MTDHDSAVHVPRPLLLGAAGAALCLLALVAGASSPAEARPPRTGVEVTTSASQVTVTDLPCQPGELSVAMTNVSETDRYADLLLSAPEPVELSREVFSSWLPAAEPDQPVTAEVGITVPRGTPSGEHSLELQVDRSRLELPVLVRPAPEKGPGDNLLLGERATASSTHGNFSTCAAVDGDADSAGWERTGWNDGTRGAFPDTFEVALSEPAPVDRVVLTTLDRAANPAERFGISDWDVQLRVDEQWRTVAEVRDSTEGEVTSRFERTTAEAVRVVVHGSNNGDYSRIVELAAYGG
ncbi:hypothetical protein GC722_00905 [Auraticoccus sp. F435]|uniref:F5/8 type C domain-containing protein n=1 Tax=Auraticoccus cholistanensis TaxID=2656650 RepID=A0A6A9UPJ2_9ACTN|nr:discoidin domain-containing protein [Auraticoccus cholistanensis]MVA74601.1 hypothetical protein [Auraticoccus cholistanensis]